MMKNVMELGNSDSNCEATGNFKLKYTSGTTVELTEDGQCSARLTKGSDRKCFCDDTPQATYQFSVADDGVVTLSLGGKSQKLTPVPSSNGSGSGGGGTSIGLIVGIAGGAVVAVLLLAAGVYCYRRQQHQQQPIGYEDANQAFITNNGGNSKSPPPPPRV